MTRSVDLCDACTEGCGDGRMDHAGWRLGDGVVPTHLEQRSIAIGIPEDHAAAALLYQQKANQLERDTARLEQQALGSVPMKILKGSGEMRFERQPRRCY